MDSCGSVFAILWKEDEDLVGVLSPLVSCRILGGAEMILKKEWVPKKKEIICQRKYDAKDSRYIHVHVCCLLLLLQGLRFLIVIYDWIHSIIWYIILLGAVSS